MHLLDTYALSCGAKIDKPHLFTSYFPMPVDKYITLQAQAKFESKDYAYWQDVIDILYPILERLNIKILQIGGKNEKVYRKVIDLRGQTNVNQLGYILQKSLLHIGPDSFGVHVASIYDIPIVALYSIVQSTVGGPRFGSKDKQILFNCFERQKNKKPSYSVTENPKSINLTKPEEIATAAFKLLNIDFKVPFETVYTGQRYCADIIKEMIPNTLSALNNPELPIELRTDIFLDNNILGAQLSYHQKAILVLDKNVDINFLKQFKKNISLIAYKINENDDPSYVKQLINEGFNMLLISRLSKEQLEPKKINYYDIGKINIIGFNNEDVINNLKKDIDNLFYRSCKLIASKDKIFGSHAAEETNIPITQDGEYQKVIDSPKFWEDLDFYTIVKKL